MFYLFSLILLLDDVIVVFLFVLVQLIQSDRDTKFPLTSQSYLTPLQFRDIHFIFLRPTHLLLMYDVLLDLLYQLVPINIQLRLYLSYLFVLQLLLYELESSIVLFSLLTRLTMNVKLSLHFLFLLQSLDLHFFDEIMGLR